MSEYREALQNLIDAINFFCPNQFARVQSFTDAKALLARPEHENENELYRLLVVRGYAQHEADAIANGPLISIEPAAAEKAREPKPEDMAMLIRQLCSALNRFNPGGPTAIRAMQYLASHGLEGSVLRDLPSPPAATGEK